MDYTTDEAKSLITRDISSDVIEHSCPESLAAIKEEDLVIWVCIMYTVQCTVFSI